MSGIAGVIDLSGEAIDPKILKSMTDVIRHRGPDDEGYVLIDQSTSHFQTYAGPDSPSDIQEFNPNFKTSEITFAGNLGLGHRRFSIIDLTSAGHQPFFCSDQSCCIVFNGTIYNYIELRAELESQGIIFRSRSDTEVLLEAYKAWDVDCFKKFNGYWALALYDFRKKRLVLSRDRIGMRPLYWIKIDSRVYFASEIKSLLQVPEIARNKKVNQEAIWYWCSSGLRDLNFSTCFESIFSLPSASWTIVDENFPNKIKTFWKVPEKRMSEKDIGITEAATLVREALTDAVRIRLRADVPIALELSGGMDSSALLALAAQIHPERIITYTVRFSDPRQNEEPFARSVAKHYKTDYRVIDDPSLNTFWNSILAFTYLQEEPFHSPNLHASQVIWSHMRNQGIKVVLTGAIGDELFAGYPHYYGKVQKENLKTGCYRRFIENALYWSERRYSVKNLAQSMISPIRHFLKYCVPQSCLPRKRNCYYLCNISMPQKRYDRETLTEVLYSEITNTVHYHFRSGDKTITGLPIEGRSPFVDYRVVEIATQLPITYLIRHGWHKWILRKALEDYLPSDVLWRKQKLGFPFPVQTFYENSRKIIDLILHDANNPYIDLSNSNKLTLQSDWKAISFILWYELFFNENLALFEKIESMVNQSWVTTDFKYTPEFFSSCRAMSIKNY